MMRPTSVWRSCTLKIVILPLGISVSTMSSGNSTSCRMMNSRNSFMSRSPIFVGEAGSFAIEREADSFHVHVDDLSFRLEAAPQMARRVAVAQALFRPVRPLVLLQPVLNLSLVLLQSAPAPALARGRPFSLPQLLLFSPQLPGS